MSTGWRLVLLAASIFLGVVYPPLAAFFRPLLLPIIFLLFLTAVLQVSFADVIRVAAKERAGWIILIWQLLVLPAIFFVLLKPLLSPQLHFFAVIALCGGSITATTALAHLFKLNSALSLVACLLGAILMPIPLYLFLQLTLGVDAAIDLNTYCLRIFVFIFLPITLAWVLRRNITVQTDQWLQQIMPSVSLVLLVLFGFAVMDGVGALMINEPARLLSYILLAFGLSISVQIISFAALYFLGLRDATTAALVCAYRNVGVVAAIAGSSLGEDFFLFLGVWQLPMYILPLLLRRFYEKGGIGISAA